MNLVFTGVTRNSKQILKNVTDNLDKIYPLLETVDKSYDALSENNYSQFLELINDGWQQKKSTTSSITENEKIKEIDSHLEKNTTVIAHKLCGAGNGGFFLTFSHPGQLTIPYNKVRINAVSDGVLGESV